MTITKSIFITLLFATSGLLISACGTSSSKSDDAKQPSEETTEQTSEQGREYTSVYICPMHCEGSGSDEPGTCPVCGMDYVLNETITYACPMHPEITGKAGDTCSQCGMDLKPVQEEDHSSHNH